MWVCSGTHSDSKPRSSSARPSGAGCMESVVKNITAPIFMSRLSQSCYDSYPTSYGYRSSAYEYRNYQGIHPGPETWP